MKNLGITLITYIKPLNYNSYDNKLIIKLLLKTHH